MGTKIYCEWQRGKRYYHFYGVYSIHPRFRRVMVWKEVANRLALFLHRKDKVVKKGWEIHGVLLGQKSAVFIVETAADPDYIQEKLFDYALEYLRREFSISLTIEAESFWASIVCIPIRNESHLVNALNWQSRRKNCGDEYVVKRLPPRDQCL